jgi:hypothetical protein
MATAPSSVQSLLNQKTNQLTTKVLDFHGRQIKNAGNAVDQQDYVTLAQLQAAVVQTKNSAVAAAGQSVASSSSERVYSLQLEGTIAIASDVCPRTFILENQTASTVRIDLKSAPTGGSAGVTVKIYQNTVLWITLVIAVSGTTKSATAAQIAALTGLVAGNYLRVDITTVGTTFRGGSLSVTIQ